MSVLSFLSADSTFCSDSMEDNIAHIRYDMAIMKQFQCIQTHGSHRYGSDGVCLYCGANGTDESAVLVDGATFNARVLEAMPNGGTATFVSSSTLVDEDTYPTTIDLSDADSIYTVYGHVNSEGTEMLIKADSYGLKANTNAASMFSGGTIAYSGLNLLDVSEVTDASNMFNGNTGIATAAELSGWDVSGITNMTSMFENCTLLTNISGLSGWNVSSYCLLDSMFASVGVTDFSPLDTWNVTNETYITTNNMFNGTTKMSIKPSWYTVYTIAKIGGTGSYSNIFGGISGSTSATNIATYTNSQKTTSKVISTSSSEYKVYCEVSDNTINVYTVADKIKIESMIGAFYNCAKLSIDTIISTLSDWGGIDGITTFASTFSGCTGITDITPLANWDMSKVTDISTMFSGCTGITDITPLANWDTSNMNKINATFAKCTGITDITPLANWDTSNVTTLRSLFNSCSGITDVTPLANWDTSKVTDIYYLLNGTGVTDASCLQNWDTSSVTAKSGAFPSNCITPTWYN